MNVSEKEATLSNSQSSSILVQVTLGDGLELRFVKLCMQEHWAYIPCEANFVLVPKHFGNYGFPRQIYSLSDL